jgi:hypothetical protein
MWAQPPVRAQPVSAGFTEAQRRLRASASVKPGLRCSLYVRMGVVVYGGLWRTSAMSEDGVWQRAFRGRVALKCVRNSTHGVSPQRLTPSPHRPTGLVPVVNQIDLG